MREKDEKIPLKYGVLGQETCGPGGSLTECVPSVELLRSLIPWKNIHQTHGC